jgi:hypothetical protein
MLMPETSGDKNSPSFFLTRNSLNQTLFPQALVRIFSLIFT